MGDTNIATHADPTKIEAISPPSSLLLQRPNLSRSNSKLDKINNSSSTHWKYKRFYLFGSKVQTPAYASPQVQLLLVAFVSFLCPGIHNALNGLGGGGLVSAGPANDANVAVYSTFAVVGFFAGIFTNKLGVRVTMALGGLGYCTFSAALLCYKHTANDGFLIFAGAQLGSCAGLFWAAQGMVLMAYPSEKEKGRFISWLWMIYNLGAVMGSLIALFQNLDNSANGVEDSTYYVFIALGFLGAVLALMLCEAKDVIRSDGSRVILVQKLSWKQEMLGFWTTLRKDTYILFYFPMFFASNWFYPYQYNDFNLDGFNIRTRALNNTLYWLSEIGAAWLIGHALDTKRLTRSRRARVAYIALFVVTMSIWGGGFAWEKQNSHLKATATTDSTRKDFTDSAYLGPMFLYMSYGFFAATWQTCTYWLLGALTSHSRKTAHFAGFYKGIQSAGAAVSFRINTLQSVSSMSEFLACWILLAGSLVVAAPVVGFKIRDFGEADAGLVGGEEGEGGEEEKGGSRAFSSEVSEVVATGVAIGR